MNHQSRRQFLSQIGQGMLVAGVGYTTAFDLGLTPAWADDAPEGLEFGRREPLVRLMQDTPAERLQPLLIKRLKQGTELRDLVAAAALANARTFGGQDYIGFHTMMALSPAYHMSQELPKSRRALPVLKVLYRNSHRIEEHGGRESQVLHRITPANQSGTTPDGRMLLEKIRNKQTKEAEQTFAAISQGSPKEAFNQLLIAVQDKTEVHRVVMPYRAWDLLDIVGKKHAHTMLRQSVRYCVHNEAERYDQNAKGVRDVLPKLLDQYKLLSKPLGKKPADDKWIAQLSETIFQSTPEQAPDAAAAALAEGMLPDAVGEAMSLAANQLVLRDPGRTERQVRPGKPVGSVHGDSLGVHACDSVNAWRNMARISNPRNTIACLILGAHQVAHDRTSRGGDLSSSQPYPHGEQLEQIKASSPKAILKEADAAIRDNDQATACAAIARYAEFDQPARPVFDLLLQYACSEDGALHAEKYYRTVSDEFANTRKTFRWRQLMALARVTASEYGLPAPGFAEAQRLLDS
jgi:hypothetical protein